MSIVATKAIKEPETSAESTVNETSAAVNDALKSVQEWVSVLHNHYKISARIMMAQFQALTSLLMFQLIATLI